MVPEFPTLFREDGSVEESEFPSLFHGFHLYYLVSNFITRVQLRDRRSVLLHREALGKVAWFVHVTAAGDGDMISQQLKRDDRQQGEQRRERPRQENHVV